MLAGACTSIGDTPLPVSVDAGELTAQDADPGPDAAPEAVSLTHNADATTITAANAVACVQQQDDGTGNQVPVFHQENGYYRVFDLAAMGVTRDLAIERVTFGVETGNPGAANQQLVEIHLFTLSGDLELANLTEIGAGQVLVPQTAQELFDVDVEAIAPAGSTLVVELRTPSGDPDRLLFIGSNAAGQTGPTFLRAPNCDDDANPDTPSAFEEPLDLTDFFPDMHVVMSVHGIF
jgi:hypothetical protein